MGETRGKKRKNKKIVSVPSNTTFEKTFIEAWWKELFHCPKSLAQVWKNASMRRSTQHSSLLLSGTTFQVLYTVCLNYLLCTDTMNIWLAGKLPRLLQCCKAILSSRTLSKSPTAWLMKTIVRSEMCAVDCISSCHISPSLLWPPQYHMEHEQKRNKVCRLAWQNTPHCMPSDAVSKGVTVTTLCPLCCTWFGD